MPNVMLPSICFATPFRSPSPPFKPATTRLSSPRCSLTNPTQLTQNPNHGPHLTQPSSTNPKTALQQADILTLRETWVAVNKPSGILVHPTKLYHSQPGETYLITQVSKTLHQILGHSINVLPVHRLDRPASGVILFALGQSQNAANLQNALQFPNCTKQYWTLVFGADMPQTWRNDHPLRDMSSKSRKQRRASTQFEQLVRLDVSDMSIVRATLETGRRHQVRRHLSHSKFPVVGDTSHGKGALNRMAREKYSVDRCCLHSRRIMFDDPQSGNAVQIDAPVPDDLRLVLKALPDYDPGVHDELADVG